MHIAIAGNIGAGKTSLTELLAKHLKLPIITKLNKNYDFIKISKVHRIKKLNYSIPSDISSSAFFIVLAALNYKSKLVIRNVNINTLHRIT